GGVELCALGASVIHLRQDRTAGGAAAAGCAQGDRGAAAARGHAGAEQVAPRFTGAARAPDEEGEAPARALRDSGGVDHADIRVLCQRARAGSFLIPAFPGIAAAPGVRLRGHADPNGFQEAGRGVGVFPPPLAGEGRVGAYNSRRVGEWRSPVAHLNGVQGAAGSNPVSPPTHPYSTAAFCVPLDPYPYPYRG